MEMQAYITLPAHEIHAHLKKRTFTCKQLVQSTLHNIRKTNQQINAFVTTDDANALAAAQRVDDKLQRGLALRPLEGIPVAIKDNILTEGLLTTCSSDMLHNFVPPFDATVIKRIKEQGMILVGKTNLDQFGMGSSTENSTFGPTRNPYDLSAVPGGTSGGSAAAVAARMVPLALGTDTGGSIRQPASFCNVIGLKPTYGRASRYGLIAYGSSLDQPGPLAYDAKDCAQLMQVIAGHDPLDATSHPDTPENYIERLDGDPQALTVGLPSEYLTEGLHPEHRRVIDETVDVLQNLGVTVKEVSLPFSKYAIPTYYIIAMSEASTNLSRYDGIRYGNYTLEGEDVFTHTARSRARGFGEEVKRRIILGTFALSAGYQDQWFNKATRVRKLLINEYQRVFEDVDMLIGPASPFPPFKIGEKFDDPLANYLADIYTVPSSLAGIPAISLPGGFTEAGLPVGVQFQASYFNEGVLLNMANILQQNTPHLNTRPVLEQIGAPA